MLKLSSYDVYIFDCDGVILDSNQLKIDAMKNALSLQFSDAQVIDKCASYFRDNFGKSRFHHVDVFVNELLPIEVEQKESMKNKILEHYSSQCKALYLKADITPGFVAFIERLNGKKYIASGSEQQELRDVFTQRGLSHYFNQIFGSPTPKADLISHILKLENSNNAIMFGDAESDFNSAHSNNIDFVFYSPFSNVKEKMNALCSSHQLPIIDDFSKVDI